MNLLAQIVRLPWATFSWLAWSAARFAQGMQEAADAGIEALLTRGLRPGKVDPSPSAAREITRQDATETRKEMEMSNDACGLDDCKVRLIQFTLVTIKRGEERILEKGEVLVVDPMTKEDFDLTVVANYASTHGIPPGDRAYLRVWSEFLETWAKQSLHYESRQLEILQEISNKIGPPVIAPAAAV